MRVARLAVAPTLALFLAAGALADTNLGTRGGTTYRSDKAVVVADRTRAVHVACAAGQHIWAGGFAADNGTMEVRASAPHAAGWLARFHAKFPDRGYSFVACRSGRVSRTSAGTSVAGGHAATLRAPCPPGTHVVGGGGRIGAGRLSGSYPFDGSGGTVTPDDGWRVRALASSETTMRVVAICARHEPRYVRRTATIAAGVVTGRTISCPRHHEPLGVGAQTLGKARLTALTAAGLRPRSGIRTPAKQARVAVRNLTTGERRVRIFAICL